MKIKTLSVRATRLLAAKLARRITREPLGRVARVLALTGELGSGKTTFTRAFARALGARDRVMSPTFVLVRRTELKNKKFKNLYHADAYRLARGTELARLGLKDAFRDPTNIVLVEWADRMRRGLPRDAQWVEFSHGAGKNERVIDIK